MKKRSSAAEGKGNEEFWKKKKSFFPFFTLTPSHMWQKRPVYRSFSGEGKCEGKLSPLTLALTLTLTPKSVWNPPCPAKAQSKSNENQKINQTKKSKKRIRVKDSVCISDNPWAFFDLSSVAAGLQSAMQQWKWRMKNEEWRIIEWRNKVRRPDGKPINEFNSWISSCSPVTDCI